MKRTSLVAVIALAVLATLGGLAQPAAGAPADTIRLQSLDEAVLERLNALRASRGLHALRMSPDLQRAAVHQSRSMLEGGFFSHDSRDGSSFVQRIKRFYTPRGFASWSAGENLVFNSAEMSASDAVSAWMRSPRHRANMLDPNWRDVGVGSLRASVARGDFGGGPAWVITMDFGVRTGGGDDDAGTSAKEAGRGATMRVLPDPAANAPHAPRDAR